MAEIIQPEGDVKSASAERGKARKDTWSKKSWYAIKTPKVFGEYVVGETPSVKDETLVGRVVGVSLSDLTKNYKQVNTTVKLRINGIHGKEASTEYAGQEMMKDALARMIRRWSSRIDTIQTVGLYDKKICIKSVLITRKKAKTSVQSVLRESVLNTVAAALAGKTLDDAIMDINTEKLHKMIYDAASKIFPIKAVEIRKVEVKSAAA